MTNFVDVVSVNPILFVKQVTEKIREGFYVQNSIAGYPLFGLPFQVRLFAGDAPEVRTVLSPEITTAIVDGYDAMRWLLDVQDVVLQGFEMDIAGAAVDNYKTVTLRRATIAPVVEEKRVEEQVEAPKATQKGKRAQKAKQTETKGE